ncbi:MAG: FKBP-type peptidyl-prolyl cis-trans isomerase [Flavobacteriales bacterium]|nr:FKBP-type peptidyl-prolyl cis-trans isomerase [Flavobacteriales bacterium]
MRIILIYAALIFIGCNGCSEQKQTADVDYEKIQKELIKARKAEHESEMKKIGDFIAENKWPMTQTSTGTYYWIYEDGGGEKAQNNDIVVLDYTIHLLDGSLCYQTDSLTLATVRVGMDNVESGIHEILLLLGEGDRARVILPSHRAFGYTGDSNKIPQNASLIYDLKILGFR